MNLKRLSKFVILALSVIFLFSFVLKTFAITSLDISANVVPPNPVPYDNVTITLSSYTVNLDSVSISWFVNGKSIKTGIGQKSFSVTAGASGSTTQVTVKMFIPDGEV